MTERAFRLRRFLPLLTGIIIAFGAAAASAAERRVAFVAGYSAYKSLPALANPAGDAKAVAALLRNLNFEVIESIDASRADMKDTLGTFAAKATGADVALFYFAGHSISVGGKNYPLAIDSDLKSSLDVKLGDDSLDSTLDQTMADAKLRIVLLDSGRTNPLTDRFSLPRGLAAMVPGQNTLIAFASAPGQAAEDGKPGEHSPFTRALLAHLGEPGLEINFAMTKMRKQIADATGGRQIAWQSAVLDREFFLNPVADTVKPGAAGAQATQGDVELEYWRAIRNSDRIEELEPYILHFPNGLFVAIARARIAQLQAEAAAPIRTAPATRETEDELKLTLSNRREVLRRLSVLGYYHGRAGSRFHEDARGAIERWQQANKYVASGYLNRLQYDALLADPQSARASDSPRRIRAPRGRDGQPTILLRTLDDSLRIDDLNRRGRWAR